MSVEPICYYDLHVIDWLIWRRDIRNMVAYTMFGRTISAHQ